MSGKRAKMRHFPYRKQNSIAEIVSTMESFFVCEGGFEPREFYVVLTMYYFSFLRIIKIQIAERITDKIR